MKMSVSGNVKINVETKSIGDYERTEVTIETDYNNCTFCGWADPADLFYYYTPGGAPVCDSCAAGLLGIKHNELPAVQGQGDGSYNSGVPRVVFSKNGKKETLYAPKKEIY